jgi:hypothetical protein
MSKKNLIERLRLKAGDIIVVKDWHTAESLIRIGQSNKFAFDFDCPILIAPDGVKKSNLKRLKEIVAYLEAKS